MTAPATTTEPEPAPGPGDALASPVRSTAPVRALCAVAVIPAVIWAVVRVAGLDQGWPLVPLIAFTPYATVLSLVPLTAALAARAWVSAVVAGLSVACLAACVLPRTFGGPSQPVGATAGPVVRVMGANLELGGADPNALVGLVRRHRIDVLSLEEYTPQAARRLKVAGLAQLLPYQQEHPVDGPRGAALYSRFPLVAGGDPMLPGEFGQAYATLLVPGAQPVMVEAVHPCAPADSTRIACWKAGLAAEPRATPHGPVRLLLGDFNATVDHSALRALLASGYRDAAEQVGAGLTMTWPYDKPLPKVALDHVLADPRIGVRTVAAYPIRDSDHRAIYAELILPATG